MRLFLNLEGKNAEGAADRAGSFIPARQKEREKCSK